jgi:uncharacterized membrane protein/mono/diheme cytochrome c family protein
MAQDPDPTRPGRTPAAWVAAGAGVWAVLVFLARQMPPDGRERGDFGQFLGRFHTILVHGPVALILLVPAMELAGLRPRWAHLRSAAGWVLALAVVATFAAAFDGWLLAWSGGLRGRDVTNHMWGGVMLAGACALAGWARSARTRGRGIPGSYPLLLLGAVGLVVWTGHFGGAITHGNGYVTEKMPAGLRRMLGLAVEIPKQAQVASAAGPGAPISLKGGPESTLPANAAYYRIHIAPLFARSCVSCHKPEKHKGGLRMDTYEQLMRGGDDGPALVSGDPKASELIRRVSLPPSDDDSMPSDGDKPLAPEEIHMVEQWIAAGAKGG